MNELNQKSATELAELIKSKEVSSKEVVETHLKRIEEVNPEINAITVTLEESATELAKKADNASDDERNRPFHGVPITIKENIDFKEILTNHKNSKPQIILKKKLDQF